MSESLARVPEPAIGDRPGPGGTHTTGWWDAPGPAGHAAQHARRDAGRAEEHPQ